MESPVWRAALQTTRLSELTNHDALPKIGLGIGKRDSVKLSPSLTRNRKDMNDNIFPPYFSFHDSLSH